MKNNFIIGSLFVAVIFLTSCFGNSNANSDEQNGVIGITNSEKSMNDELEFYGTYDSKTGVMNNISCYCYEVGYFRNEEGEEFPICFSELGEEAQCSNNLWISGYFETVSITPEETSPCPAGEREIFFVTDFECMEEETTSEIIEFYGTYDSKMGAMNNISCYCYEAGFFTTEEGDEISVCFSEMGGEPECYENLRIVGYFETVTITPEETSPCPSGERELFFVTDYECM